MKKYKIIHTMAFFLALVVPVVSQVVNATLIDPNISITGGTTYVVDEDFGFGAVTGAMTNTVGGGTTTTSIISGSIDTGVNPLNSTLTDTGDGFRFDGSASVTGVDDEFAIAFDNTFTITNNSASSSFDIVLRLEHSNMINSSGNDAFVSSEFFVEQDGSEIFFNHILTDTFNGNESGGEATGSTGGPLDTIDTELIALSLSAGESVIFELIWTLEGGNFADSGLAAFDSFFDISVDSVKDPTVVPIPGALILFGTGLFGLLGYSRQRG